MLSVLLETCVANVTFTPHQKLLQEAVRAWFYCIDPKTVFTIPYQQYPPELNLLIRQQNHIGWRQLFHRRISAE
jgi:hypothetical protein